MPPASRKGLVRDFLIAEILLFLADDLIVLMALAGNEHHVVAARFVERAVKMASCRPTMER